MTDSIKMAKLDLMSIKSQWLSYLGIILVVLIFRLIKDAPVAMMLFIVAWFELIIIANIFITQEKSGLDRLYGILSINVKDIVLGRYISVFIIYILSMIACTGVLIITITTAAQSINWSEIMFGFSLSFLVFSLGIGVQFPIIFKIGFIKAKIWSLVVFLSIVFSTAPIIPTIFKLVQSNQPIIIIISLLLSFLIQFISYQVSIISYKNSI